MPYALFKINNNAIFSLNLSNAASFLTHTINLINIYSITFNIFLICFLFETVYKFLIWGDLPVSHLEKISINLYLILNFYKLVTKLFPGNNKPYSYKETEINETNRT